MGRRVREPVDSLDQGREAYARQAWLDAFDLLTGAHERVALAAPDLELLATCAFMLGRDDESAAWLERGHQRYLAGGDTLPAVRCAVWIGLNLASRGQATGRRHRPGTKEREKGRPSAATDRQLFEE